MSPELRRTMFQSSRRLDFFSERELVAQVGHPAREWALVVMKESMDNAIDECEEAGIAPQIDVVVESRDVSVSDNGRGIPADAVEKFIDFDTRTSSREAYVSPTRGAQGNALKTIVAMPFVSDPSGDGYMEIEAQGVRHRLTVRLDRIRQLPEVRHEQEQVERRTGTSIRVKWADSASSIVDLGSTRFLQLALGFVLLNPHLTLRLRLFGETFEWGATDPGWAKWRPSDPTSAHWYRIEDFERLVAAYIGHDADHGRDDRTVRELVAEFRGLSGSAKQKQVLGETGLRGVRLAQLAESGELDRDKLTALLTAMQAQSRPVKPQQLGTIGEAHIRARLLALGAEPDSVNYKRVLGADELPSVTEVAFGWLPNADDRLVVAGANWSPGIVNPFRQLGSSGDSLDALLEEQRAGASEPVAVVIHLARPRVQYTDRGKSAVVIGGEPNEF